MNSVFFPSQKVRCHSGKDKSYIMTLNLILFWSLVVVVLPLVVVVVVPP